MVHVACQAPKRTQIVGMQHFGHFAITLAFGIKVGAIVRLQGPAQTILIGCWTRGAIAEKLLNNRVACFLFLILIGATGLCVDQQHRNR